MLQLGRSIGFKSLFDGTPSDLNQTFHTYLPMVTFWTSMLNHFACSHYWCHPGLGPHPLLSPYTKSLGYIISSYGLFYHCYADNTQLLFSFLPSDTQVATRISACLADISVWMLAHRLKLNFDKTGLLLLSGKTCPLQDDSIMGDNSMVSPT